MQGLPSLQVGGWQRGSVGKAWPCPLQGPQPRAGRPGALSSSPGSHRAPRAQVGGMWQSWWLVEGPGVLEDEEESGVAPTGRCS